MEDIIEETKQIETIQRITDEANRLYIGYGCKKDKVKALELYYKAADMGDVYSLIKIANIYNHKKEKNYFDSPDGKYDEIVLLYERAIDMGCDVAITKLAKFLNYNGDNDDPNTQLKIDQLLDRAIELNDTKAMCIAAERSRNDVRNSIELYEKAICLGNIHVRNCLIDIIGGRKYFNRGSQNEFINLFVDKTIELMKENKKLKALVEEAELHPCCGKQFKEACKRFDESKERFEKN